ncbi:nuclear transport factor 2 family protein [Actinomadura fulvescens]|uniref:SnoaL-like domain-containing protein n=1 Tax=Actinomadura fulvescens TaxID=46160 RepID=A0ABN3QBM3_9ACTN
MEANTELALRYHAAVASGAIGADLAAYLTPDFVHHELPNLFFPDGNLSDLPAVLAAAERGQGKLASQTYRVRNTVACGDTVALEIEWTGTLKSGPTLRAHIATFLDFRDGKICGQRNYDCYEKLPDL